MKNVTGMWALTRLALHRDRVLLPAWVAAFTVLTVGSAWATMALYPTESSRITAATAVNDVPVAVAIYGRIWDPTSLGALSLLKLAAMGGVMIGILGIMMMTRHLRAEEEKGRAELLAAAPIGRYAQLTAAFIVTTVALLLVGLLSALGLIAVGLPAAGSFAFGLSWSVMGLTFASIAAITNQLTAAARSATAIAMVILGLSYLMRAVGDVLGDAGGPSWLSWVSPIGWGQQIRPYAGDQFVVLSIPLIASAIFLGLAGRLQSVRDIGSGLIQDRSGRATAPTFLSTPLGLAWRLQYPMLLGWLIAYVVFSAVIGSIINDLSGMLDTPQAQQMITALGGSENLMKSFVAMEFGIIAFITAAYGIVAARRLSTEETSGHTEVLLATQTSRTQLVLSHLWIALFGTLVLTLVQGCVFALANAVQSGDYSQVGSTITASLVTLPAIWIMIAIVITMYGINAQFTSAAWVLMVAFLLVAELGSLLSWPQWLMESSPFAHIPKLPAAQMEWAPMFSLTAVAVFLIAFGLIRMRRRDIQG